MNGGCGRKNELFAVWLTLRFRFLKIGWLSWVAQVNKKEAYNFFKWHDCGRFLLTHLSTSATLKMITSEYWVRTLVFEFWGIRSQITRWWLHEKPCWVSSNRWQGSFRDRYQRARWVRVGWKELVMWSHQNFEHEGMSTNFGKDCRLPERCFPQSSRHSSQCHTGHYIALALLYL